MRIEKPFAHCCAEAGGDVERCDCVNKDHGTAWFSVRTPSLRQAGGRCTASPDHADILETIENAADDWQKNGYTSALAEVRDMANIGRALMQALPEGYSYMNCPSEIVSDLQNERDEALAAISPPSADAAMVEAAARIIDPTAWGDIGHDDYLRRADEWFAKGRPADDCLVGGYRKKAADMVKPSLEKAAALLALASRQPAGVVEPHVFLDCDGVLADFDTYAEAYFGMPPRQYEKQVGSTRFWQELEAKGDFYRNLPLMPDAMALYEGVKHLHPTILTGCPRGDWAQGQKVAWAAEHFPGVPIITCRSADKRDYAKPGDVLIDDWPQHRHRWIEMGGVFIVHHDAESSLAALRAHYPNLPAAPATDEGEAK